MKVTVMDGDTALAREAAAEAAAAATRAVEARGVFTVAFSGGSTPAGMLAALVDHDLPWHAIHVLQVDERLVGEDHPDRNLGLLRRQLLDHVAVPATNVHPMPGAPAGSPDPAAAADRYADELGRLCGEPPVLDLVHLGLGTDGHTASLVPGDTAVEVVDRRVVVTGPHDGHRRMTLTVPVLRRARQQLWLVSGGDKAEVVRRLVHGEGVGPADRVVDRDASLLLDTAAASRLRSGDSPR